jgi:uroporphyrinogen decarboxylase
MNSRERVFKAFKKLEGNPDRVPIQFDLCHQHIETFGKRLKGGSEFLVGTGGMFSPRLTSSRQTCHLKPLKK